jgi:CHAD domain-containing protein
MHEQISDAPSTLGAYARKVIRHEFDRLMKHEDAVLEDTDSEPLHQMRVGMRRLRAALGTFSLVIILPKDVTVQGIAKISKQLGATRDWDVLNQTLKEDFQPLLKGSEQDRLDEALLHIKKHRKYSFSHLKKALTGKRYKTLTRSLQEWIEHPTFETIAELPIDLVLPDLLMPMTSEFLLHPGWWVVPFEFGSAQNLPNTPNIEQKLEYEVLHSLRKKAKGIRYQSEFFKSFYPPAYGDYIKDLKIMQETLGQLQDCKVLGEFLTSELTTCLDKTLPTVAQKLQQLKHESWETWEPLRQRFVDVEFRRNLRSQILNSSDPA